MYYCVGGWKQTLNTLAIRYYCFGCIKSFKRGKEAFAISCQSDGKAVPRLWHNSGTVLGGKCEAYFEFYFFNIIRNTNHA